MLLVIPFLRHSWRIGAFERMMSIDVRINECEYAYNLVSLLMAYFLLYERLVHLGGDIGEAKSCHAKSSGGNDLRLK